MDSGLQTPTFAALPYQIGGDTLIFTSGAGLGSILDSDTADRIVITGTELTSLTLKQSNNTGLIHDSSYNKATLGDDRVIEFFEKIGQAGVYFRDYVSDESSTVNQNNSEGVDIASENAESSEKALRDDRLLGQSGQSLFNQIQTRAEDAQVILFDNEGFTPIDAISTGDGENYVSAEQGEQVVEGGAGTCYGGWSNSLKISGTYCETK